MRWAPLSLAADADMDATGTSSWTASSATLTKDTSTVKWGRQALKVANTGANGYARTANIPVIPNTGYRLGAYVSVGSGSATLQAYDVTGAAAIDTRVSTGVGAWEWIYFDFTTPGSCVNVQVRLIGVAASAVNYWQWVVLHRRGQTLFDLPAEVTESRQLINIHAWREYGYAGPDSGTRIADQPEMALWPNGYDLVSEDIAANRFRVNLRSRILGHSTFSGTSLYYPVAELHVPYDDLTDETTSTNCPLDWIAPGVEAMVHNHLLNDPGLSQQEVVHYTTKRNEALGLWVAQTRARRPLLKATG